jgi:hypothetical protein
MLMKNYREIRKRSKNKVKKELTRQNKYDITKIMEKSVVSYRIYQFRRVTVPDLVIRGRN